MIIDIRETSKTKSKMFKFNELINRKPINLGIITKQPT